MKKLNYEKPQFDVVEVEARDIIATSCTGTDMSSCSGLDQEDGDL